jgi:hypothetical protein
VDAETRDRWTVGTAEQTLHRVGAFATALSLETRGEELERALAERGVDEGLAAGITLALDHYGTSPGYLAAAREMALDAARLVAGEIDEVDPVSVPPDVDGTDLDALDTDTPGGAGAAAAAGGTDGSSDLAGENNTGTTTEPTADRDLAGDTASDASTESGGTTGRTGPDEPVSGTDGTGSIAAGTGGGGAVDPGSGAERSADPAGDQADAAADDGPAETDAGSAEVGDFDPGEFELDEEEREEIEAEYGTEFQSGTEVEEPGAADIETPSPADDSADGGGPEPGADAGAERGVSTPDTGPDSPTVGDADVRGEPVSGPEPSADPDPTDAPEQVSDAEPVAEDTTPAGGPDPTADTAPTDEPGSGEDAGTTDIDLADATVEVMTELDGGDGADRAGVVDAVVERHGVPPADVEEAIQDALMDGRCYEPDDDTLKPI